MDLTELGELIDGARRSLFRLETLQQYLVPGEDEDFAAWRAGKPLTPRTPENTEWLAELQELVTQGFRRYRVHIVDQPLTDYMRFELLGYTENHAAGEEIHIAERHRHPALAGLHEDFWLIDDEVAIRMVYDDAGHFLCPEPIDDPTPYRGIRNVTMRCAEPLDAFLERTRVRLTA